MESQPGAHGRQHPLSSPLRSFSPCWFHPPVAFSTCCFWFLPTSLVTPMERRNPFDKSSKKTSEKGSHWLSLNHSKPITSAQGTMLSLIRLVSYAHSWILGIGRVFPNHTDQEWRRADSPTEHWGVITTGGRNGWWAGQTNKAWSLSAGF